MRSIVAEAATKSFLSIACLILLIAGCGSAQQIRRVPQTMTVAGGGGGSSITLVASTGKSSTTSGAVTTDAIDTSGASLLVVGCVWYDNGTLSISDSKGNTWVAGSITGGSGDPNVRFYYVKNPTVGSGHTFTCGGTDLYPAIGVFAFNNTDTTANLDQENGSSGNSPLATGSITPSVDNEVVVALVGGHQTSMSIDGGFTKVIDLPESTGEAIAMAYLVQTTAAAANPTWTATGTGTGLGAAIASFKKAP